MTGIYIGNFSNYEIQKFNSFGVNEDDFITSVISNFRSTVYVSNKYPSDMTNYFLSDYTFHSDMTFVPRSINLTDIILRDAGSLAKEGKSLTFNLQLSSVSGSLSLTHTITPASLSALSLLKSHPSYKSLLNHIMNTRGTNHDHEKSKQELNFFLNLFIRANMLTIWMDGDSAPNAPLFDSNTKLTAAPSYSKTTEVPLKDEIMSTASVVTPQSHSQTTSSKHKSGLGRKSQSKGDNITNNPPVANVGAYTSPSDDKFACDLPQRYATKGIGTIVYYLTTQTLFIVLSRDIKEES